MFHLNDSIDIENLQPRTVFKQRNNHEVSHVEKFCT